MKKDEGSDALYQLIHRLDANEKGYVKKYLKPKLAQVLCVDFGGVTCACLFFKFLAKFILVVRSCEGENFD